MAGRFFVNPRSCFTKQSASQVMLQVSAAFERALCLYQSCGFETTSVGAAGRKVLTINLSNT